MHWAFHFGENMDYYGKARTNYVRIADIRKLEKRLAGRSIRIVKRDLPIPEHRLSPSERENDTPPMETLYAFIVETEDGYWPTTEEDEDNGAMGPETDIVPFMEPGEVLVLIHVGSEGNRYLNGFAEAWDTNGNTEHIELDEIYVIAAQRLGMGRMITKAEW